MLDINLIREHPDLVKENIKKKFQDEKLPLVDELLEKDEKFRKLKQEVDSLRQKRNSLSKDINEAKKAGKDIKKILKDAKEIPKKVKDAEYKINELQTRIKEIIYKIPNIIHKSVPLGKDDSKNVELRRVGEPKVPKYEVFNHAELAEKLNGVDFDSARATSGNGFYFLKGDIALLHSAMLAFAKDFMVKEGFTFTIPPFMVRSKVVDGVMSFEEKDNMMYKVEGEDLYLIGTSEHSMIGKFIDKTIKADQLPVKLTGYSPCFRKEIGAHGIEEKGFYRLHQFEKQEMIVICEPGDSYNWYDKMLEYTIKMFKALNVPTRVFECCSGDLADLKAKSCDVEAWSPRQKKYYEVGSLTNMEEAQARRLNIKIGNQGKRYFAHTLNNTVVATPRALIAVMENNQLKDGSIKIPTKLQPYMQGRKKIEMPKTTKNKKK